MGRSLSPPPHEGRGGRTGPQGPPRDVGKGQREEGKGGTWVGRGGLRPSLLFWVEDRGRETSGRSQGLAACQWPPPSLLPFLFLVVPKPPPPPARRTPFPPTQHVIGASGRRGGTYTPARAVSNPTNGPSFGDGDASSFSSHALTHSMLSPPPRPGALRPTPPGPHTPRRRRSRRTT